MKKYLTPAVVLTATSLLMASKLLGAPAKAPAGFTEHFADVNGVRLHYFVGGKGSPVVLLHGYAETSHMWFPIMPLLATNHMVIVPDLRGAGDSSKPESGYDKKNMAVEIHDLVASLGIHRASVVGHDIGLMVAYAYAAQFPQETERLVLMDAFLPGIGDWKSVWLMRDLWHFHFYGEVPLALVKGRERTYLDHFWNDFAADPKHSVPEADRQFYAKAYAQPGGMRAGFEYFRNFERDAKDLADLAATQLPMPVFVLGGEKSGGEFLIAQARLVASNVRGEIVSGSGHWLMEEAPQTTIPALISFINEPVSATADSDDAIQHHTISVNGVKLHYVVIGKGEPVVLLPGWPESWYAWRRVMPEFVKNGRLVFVIDPRGLGDSDKPSTGYDPETIANDLHGFIEALDLAKNGGVDIVAHDVGTWIAFHHATRFPQDVRRLVLTEASIPGVSSLPGGTPDDATNVRVWHFGFNRLDDLPEMLVQGHEREYLTWFFDHKTLNKQAFDQTAINEYVRLFSRPGSAKASFDYYRAAFNTTGITRAKDSAARRLTMPVLALGGEGGVGSALLKTLQPLGDHVSGGVLTGYGHYLPEECPDELTRAILEFWKANPSEPKPQTK